MSLTSDLPSLMTTYGSAFPFISAGWRSVAWKTKRREKKYSFYFHTLHFYDCGIDLDIKKVTYPDHIDTNEDFDRIVMRDALEHPHVRIKSCFSCDLFRYR